MEALSRMPFTAQKDVFKQLEEYADIHHLNKKEVNRQTALRLLAMGLAPQQIAEATQLSLDEVKALQAN